MNGNNPEAQNGVESLQITVCRNGVVNIRNPDSERGHSVMLADNGTAVHCSCKGYKFNSHCYHTGEIESRPLVVSSAQAARSSYNQIATDGGERQ